MNVNLPALQDRCSGSAALAGLWKKYLITALQVGMKLAENPSARSALSGDHLTAIRRKLAELGIAHVEMPENDLGSLYDSFDAAAGSLLAAMRREVKTTRIEWDQYCNIPASVCLFCIEH